MARIGSSIASGPFFEPSFDEEDFRRIADAAAEYEAPRKIVITAALGEGILKAVRYYIRDRCAAENEPTWKELKAYIGPVAKAARELNAAVCAMTSSAGKKGRTQHAMGRAEDLIRTYYPGHDLDLAALLSDGYLLAHAATRALADCERSGAHRGREPDRPLHRCLAELKKVYEEAGGESVMPRSGLVDRTDDVVEMKSSGFVMFVHECLNRLPAEIYPYKDKHPNESIALAKQVERYLRPAGARRGPASFLDVVLAESAARAASRPDQN